MTLEAALLLLASFTRDVEARVAHLPPPAVASSYSQLCWTWDSPGWFFYHADMAHKSQWIMDRLRFAEEARRCVTPRQWATQEWPVPDWWRDEVPTGRRWR